MKKVLVFALLVGGLLCTSCTDSTEDLKLENEKQKLQLTEPGDDGTGDDEDEESDVN